MHGKSRAIRNMCRTYYIVYIRDMGRIYSIVYIRDMGRVYSIAYIRNMGRIYSIACIRNMGRIRYRTSAGVPLPGYPSCPKWPCPQQRHRPGVQPATRPSAPDGFPCSSCHVATHTVAVWYYGMAARQLQSTWAERPHTLLPHVFAVPSVGSNVLVAHALGLTQDLCFWNGVPTSALVRDACYVI
jgi:hypothetical protein